MSTPKKVLVVGAGHRGAIYADFALTHPRQMQVVGVVEPHATVRDAFADRYGAEHRFASFDSFLAARVAADAVFVCSPDAYHYPQTIASLEAGYAVLLEKPIALTWDECVAIRDTAHRTGLPVAVCFPLRYHPLYRRVEEIVGSGELGSLISINHTEYIGIDRMTHNFVRGAWNRADRTGTLLLSKSCHDLDWIVALAGGAMVSGATQGSLRWFRAENAPKGSTDRCISCSIEERCPYSAIDLYKRRGKWLRHFQRPIEEELAHGPHGRCVYRCDNDLWDHQSTSLLMSSGVDVSFSMHVFTHQTHRRTHLMGSLGELIVPESFDRIEVQTFKPNACRTEDFSALPESHHAGADWGIVADFLATLETGKDIPISIDRALESHRIAFGV